MDESFLETLSNFKNRLHEMGDEYKLANDGEYIVMAHGMYKRFSELAGRYGSSTEHFLKLLTCGAIPDDILEHLQDEEFWKHPH